MHYIGCNKRFTLRTVWSEDIACLSCLARALGASCKGNCSLVCSSSPSWQPYCHHWSGNSSTHQARGVRCHCLIFFFSLVWSAWASWSSLLDELGQLGLYVLCWLRCLVQRDLKAFVIHIIAITWWCITWNSPYYEVVSIALFLRLEQKLGIFLWHP